MAGEDHLEAISSCPPFRSDRFYAVNGEWFFAIRRGPAQGPFATRAAAEAALEVFLATQREKQRQRDAENDLVCHGRRSGRF